MAQHTYRGSRALGRHLRDLTGNAVKVYTAMAILADREGLVQASLSDLAAMTDLSDSTVRRTIKDLSALSLVTRLAHPTQHAPTKYLVNLDQSPVTPQAGKKVDGKPGGRSKFARIRLDEIDSIRTY